MKRIWMKAISLLLCLVLYLSGTAFAENARVAMGRYVETKLNLYGDWRAFAQANGTIYAVDGSGEQLLKSIDLNNDNWDSLETGHDENTAPALGGINGITVAPDGTLYLSSGWAMMNEAGYPYVERIKDGHAERVDLDQRLGGDTDQLVLCTLPSGELLGLSDIEVYRFSAEGATVQKYAVPGGVSMAVHGNEVAVCSTSNSLISVLDIGTGETLRMIPLPGEADYGVVGYDANGALYYVCPDGLYQANAGSTMLVQIADGKLMTAGKPNVEARTLLFDPENNPIIAYFQGGSLSLVAYRFNENVPTEPNNLLSVYALYDSQSLREYINQFQQAYPDIIIDLTVGLPKGTAITRDDAIRTLNTELLTGNGPDVMILDGLPVGSYIQQGVLLDLAPVVQPMLDSGELQANVAGAFKTGDAIPAVPTRFLLPTIWGEVAGLNTLADLAAWAQANPDALPVYALDPELLVGTFYLTCAPAWFNDAGQLDEGAMADFLTNLKAIRGSWTYEAGVQKGGEDYKASAAGNGIQVTDWNPYDWSVPRIEEAMGGIMMMKGLQRQLPRLLRGKSSASEVNGQLIASGMSGGGFALLPGQAEGCYVPMLTLGVSRSSANSEIALAFVSYALGAKAQDVMIDDSCGFPVNSTVLGAMLAEGSNSEEEMSAGGGDDGIEWTDTWLNQTQELIRAAFKEWIFKDMRRRETLVAGYNELFNAVRPREYDGSHIRFVGMTPEITLMQHQKNAIAHILYGENVLLAHCVGAGKTFQMIAAGMEARRLGLSQKNLYVVPNHLTEQWGADFLRLYPGANILVATKKDFEPANRKKFCSRIATGDYDAIIIGHTQFEKIPLSHERQAAMIQAQIDEITTAIAEEKAEQGGRYTIKQMERTRKGLEARLKKLNDQSRKDDVVTFEQLGVDRLFVDESHYYKNLFLYTKMTNVAGIQTTDAQKSSDMYLKCRYLDELTGGKGITFATGTPISNSMVELYTIMRYLQYDTLQRTGLGHFDSWASTFGETVTAIELAPEGTGYRAKTRFARFFNLPELISMFKEVADVQTADMLKLPVPKAEFVNEVLKPSEIQQDMVASFSDRAEAVRSGRVDPREDNMLRITNDGRKCALDQRLMNPLLPDDEESKVNACIRNAFKVWQDGQEDRTAQVIFCDLSTPKGDGSFNVYDDIRNKLEAMGVPREEIAFIHEATTETQKAELFAKIRAGQVRVLLGSTAKLGAGTNMQDRLIALHHLDAPWKPSDLEQQEGRILRQGNMNEKVQIFRYVTEGTFDAYMWQILENKQKFISQIMTSKSPVRACEDVDDTALSYAEIKALATGNPYIKEKMDLDIQVAKLRMLRASHTSQIYRLETDIARTYPVQIASVQQRIANLEADKAAAALVLAMDKEQFEMKVSGVVYTDRKDAGNALIKACTAAKTVSQELPVGEYHGFRLSVSFDTFTNNFELSVRGQGKYTIKLGADPFGNLTRINNVLEGFADSLEESKRKLATLEQQLETAKEEVAKPFPQEQELIQKEARLSELNALLNMDERGSEAALIDEEATVDEEPRGRAAAEEQREDAVEAEESEQDEVEQETVKPKRYQMAI